VEKERKGWEVDCVIRRKWVVHNNIYVLLLLLVKGREKREQENL
jgi:hypothetical protein